MLDVIALKLSSFDMFSNNKKGNCEQLSMFNYKQPSKVRLFFCVPARLALAFWCPCMHHVYVYLLGHMSLGDMFGVLFWLYEFIISPLLPTPEHRHTPLTQRNFPFRHESEKKKPIFNFKKGKKESAMKL